MKNSSVEKYITVDPEICHGKPCFRINDKPSRIMIYLILELLEEGASHDEIIRHYPALTPEHIRTAIHYAAELAKNSEYFPFNLAE